MEFVFGDLYLGFVFRGFVFRGFVFGGFVFRGFEFGDSIKFEHNFTTFLAILTRMALLGAGGLNPDNQP